MTKYYVSYWYKELRAVGTEENLKREYSGASSETYSFNEKITEKQILAIEEKIKVDGNYKNIIILGIIKLEK